jgi:pimeloyl-ACP methyl ester carboxylesterase
VTRAGAWFLLRPTRAPHDVPTEGKVEPFRVGVEEGVALEGWFARASSDRDRRGLILFLHGFGANQGLSITQQLRSRGYDVAFYSARGHGESGGVCTHGAREGSDVGKILDELVRRGAAADRTIVIGHSLGANVALMAGATDARVRGVVASAAFPGLEHVARKMKPAVLSDDTMDAILARAATRGRFRLAETSLPTVARRLTIPRLILRGSEDPNASADLLGTNAPYPSREVVIPELGHNGILASALGGAAIVRFLDELP